MKFVTSVVSGLKKILVLAIYCTIAFCVFDRLKKLTNHTFQQQLLVAAEKFCKENLYFLNMDNRQAENLPAVLGIKPDTGYKRPDYPASYQVSGGVLETVTGYPAGRMSIRIIQTPGLCIGKVLSL